MSEKPDNPPAFPRPYAANEVSQIGMTLRDYFAAAALQGMVSDTPTMNSLNEHKQKGDTVFSLAALAAYVDIFTEKN